MCAFSDDHSSPSEKDLVIEGEEKRVLKVQFLKLFLEGHVCFDFDGVDVDFYLLGISLEPG